MNYGNENWYYKKKLSLVLLAAVIVALFAATAFGANDTYLANNLRVFPNLVVNGKTQPVIPMHANDWVNEEVWVETPLDSDEDGKRDLCCFHYSIPISSKVSTNILTTPLLVVPMLITATPYTGNSVPSSVTNPLSYQYLEPKVDGPWPGEDNPSTLHYTYKDVEDVRKLYKDIAAADFKPDWLPPERTTWIVETDGASRGSTTPPNSPGFTPYFRSRGYGYGCHYIIGTARAEGFLHMKDYNEYISAAAVVDWLNGRVKAYRYPYPVRLATADELASNPRLSATTPNLNQNVSGDHILDSKYIRDDINGGYVEVKANWATGYAMLAGQSYEGCMSVQAMITGVEGLKVVVPFAPTIGIYDYYRANGTVRAPGGYQGEDIPEWMVHSYGRLFNPSTNPAVTHPTTMGNNNPEIWDKYYSILDDILTSPDRYTGSYNKWWDARHAAKYVKDAKGAIIAFHGFNDWNVTFKNTALLYEACKKEGVAIKGVFHLMKHASPWTQAGFDFLPRIHTVLDNMLYGIENEGLDAFPNVIIHNNDTLEYEEHKDWPINDRYQKFYPTGANRVGSLSINKPKQIELLDFVEEKALTLVRPVITATSNPQMAAAQYTIWKHNIIGGSDTPLSSDNPFNILPNQDRLIYTVDISEDTRISGYIKMTAKIASDKKVGGISAMLVDYGAANYVHRTFTSAGTIGSTTNVSSVQNWPAGNSSSGTWDAGVTNLTILNKNTAVDPWNIISRGHVSVQKPNYNGKIWADAPETNYIPEFYYQTTVIEPGKFYPYTWELNVTDYTLKAGHKLGLILYSTDPEHIQRPLANPTKFTVEIGPDTYLNLPLVGAFVTDEIPEPEVISPEDAFNGIGNIPKGTQIVNGALVWNTVFDGEGMILSNEILNGWRIVDIYGPASGVGWNAYFDGEEVVVFFTGDASGELHILLAKTGAVPEEGILIVKFTGKEESDDCENKFNGCNVAYAAFAMFILVPFVIRKRR